MLLLLFLHIPPYGMDHVITFRNTMRQSIEKKLFKIDEMKSKLDKCNNRKKRKYKKAMNRKHYKINNIQDELHYKICLYLCRNYDRIMVTDFSSKKVSKKEGNLNQMSKRILHKLSHYRFRQRIQNKCQEYDCKYLEVSEDYTSKTCGLCGEINNK